MHEEAGQSRATPQDWRVVRSVVMGMLVATGATYLFGALMAAPIAEAAAFWQHPIENSVFFLLYSRQIRLAEAFRGSTAALSLFWFYLPVGAGVGWVARHLPAASGSLVGTVVRSTAVGLVVGLLALGAAVLVVFWRRPALDSTWDAISTVRFLARVLLPYCVLWLVAVGLLQARWQRTLRRGA